MLFFRIATAGLFILASCACASVGVTKLKETQAKPKSCSLDIYTTEAEIKRPYEVLCLLDSKTGGSAFADKTMAGAIKLAKPAACQCGADAILVAGGRAEGISLFTWGEGFAVMKAIRYSPATP